MHQEIIDDLAKSGLEPQDIRARQVTDIELATTGVHGSPNTLGYVIPYYDLAANPINFYRIRLFNTEPKYKQPIKTSNHIYFPPKLDTVALGAGYVLIVEGEKKAACAVKHGIPAIAVSGVYSWSNRRLRLPKGVELEHDKAANILVKFPSGMSVDSSVQLDSTLAEGLKEFILWCIDTDTDIIICFDTDLGGIKIEVQTAAARLGYELKYAGVAIDRIRQLKLPGARGKKVGLDDFIMSHGVDDLHRILRDCRAKRCGFPPHPNPREYLAKRLQHVNPTRKDIQNTAMAVLLELETRGRRIRTQDGGLCYFDEQNHILMPVIFTDPRKPLYDSAFGAHLYNEYCIGGGDRKVIEWLATQFAGEDRLERAQTHKVFARRPGLDSITFQISDTEYVIISADPNNPITIKKNGDDGILFEQGHVAPIAGTQLETEFMKQLYAPWKMHWKTVLQQMNFRDIYFEYNAARVFTTDQQLLAASLLFYLSPWFMRWRGTQLPVELVIGEAGSGKSTLYGLRQTIITGKANLSNMTNDIRDWYAGVSSVGGLYILDNIHFTSGIKDYRQRLSDEICRLVTEPNPHIEVRKLYTTSDIASLSVTCALAMTAIEMPFKNTDLIQRAAIFEMEGLQGSHNSMWATQMLDLLGGRLGWLAHHLVFVHKFLKSVVYEHTWKSNFIAGHRLVNYEQAMRVAATLFDIDPDIVTNALVERTSFANAQADAVMGGLCDFVNSMENEHGKGAYAARWTATEIAAWMEFHDTHCMNPILINPRSLGRYLAQYKANILRIARLMQLDRRHNNRFMYVICLPPKPITHNVGTQK